LAIENTGKNEGLIEQAIFGNIARYFAFYSEEEFKKYLEKAGLEIIEATKQGAGDLPVSVKTRIGLNKPDLDGWIRMILEIKIAVLTIHGRTMAEMSKVPAHWDLIGEAAKMAHEMGTLAVGNGDVMSLKDGHEKAEQYGVDGIMVGRGIFHNPWFFNEDIDYKSVSPKERLGLLLKHSHLFEELWQGRKSFDLMKKFFKINQYIRHPKVRVIDGNGENLGVLDLNVALEKAAANGMDLVEVTDKSNPPVCRIIDFRKFHYQEQKKHQQSFKKAINTGVASQQLKHAELIGASVLVKHHMPREGGEIDD